MDTTMRLMDFPSVIETIKGKICEMARPAINHAEAGANLIWLFKNYFRGRECKFFPEPLVQLGDDEVVPDICVVCDRTKIKETRIIGAPDLIIEILSPSTRNRDVEDKYALYAEHGIREYWIVDPKAGSVTVYVLDSDGRYEPPRSHSFISEREKADLVKYGRQHLIVEEMASVIFPDLIIRLSELFDYMED